MTSVNPEISCIRMGSGPALFGLARFYCTTNVYTVQPIAIIIVSYTCMYPRNAHACADSRDSHAGQHSAGRAASTSKQWGRENQWWDCLWTSWQYPIENPWEIGYWEGPPRNFWGMCMLINYMCTCTPVAWWKRSTQLASYCINPRGGQIQ